MLKKLSNNRLKLSNGILALALLLSSTVFPVLFDDVQAPTSEPIQTELVLDGNKEVKKHISYKKIVVALTGIQNLCKNIAQQNILRIFSDNIISQISYRQNLKDIFKFEIIKIQIQKYNSIYSKQKEIPLILS